MRNKKAEGENASAMYFIHQRSQWKLLLSIRDKSGRLLGEESIQTSATIIFIIAIEKICT